MPNGGTNDLTPADFGADTSLSGNSGEYVATLSPAWEVWGPQGGYAAAVALRAAGAESEFPRPASFHCQFLNVAQFGDIHAEVTSLRRTRRAEALRVSLTQEKPVLEALVWTVAELTGIDHTASEAPEAPVPGEVESLDWPGGPPFRFWENFDARPVYPALDQWQDATSPRSLGWSRLLTRPALEDAFIDAGRMLCVADSAMFPAATLAHEGLFPYIAPSLDLNVSFHAAARDSEWLLIEAQSPVSRGAVVAGRASIWSQDGQLVASAAQQMLQRT
jgi:acyl-CoA thioesterase